MEETKKPIRVRIQNDGLAGYRTRITDVETGREMYGVARVVIDPDKAIQAQISVYHPFIDVIADAEIRHICPYCGKPQEEASEG